MTERMTAAEYRKIMAPKAAPKRDIGPPDKAPKKRLPRKKAAAPKSNKEPVTFRKAVIRLMAFAPPRNVRIKPEEQLAIEFATVLREYTITGELSAVWTHPANEIAGQRGRLAQLRYAIAKAMGLIPGTADYLFLWAAGSGALEAKVGRNGQQPNQIDFEVWCDEIGVPYRTFTSVEQGLSILREWGILSPARSKE